MISTTKPKTINQSMTNNVNVNVNVHKKTHNRSMSMLNNAYVDDVNVTPQRPAQSHKLWWPRDTGLALNTAPWSLIVSSMLAFHKMAQNRIHTTPDWPMSSKLPQMQFDKSQQTTSHTTDTCTHHFLFCLHRITNLSCTTTPKHPPPSNSRSRTTPWPPSGRARCRRRLRHHRPRQVVQEMIEVHRSC